MLQSAVNLANVTNCMYKVTKKSPIFDPKLLPFTSSVSEVFFRNHQLCITDSAQQEHQQRLMMFSLHGNSIFTLYQVMGTVALLNSKASLIEHNSCFFTAKNIDVSNVHSLATMLES